MAYIASLYKPLERSPARSASLHQQLVAAQRSLDLLDTEPEVAERPDAVDVRRVPGDVAYEDVTFGYRGGRRHAGGRHASRCPPGGRVAVVGPTGAGKSTLVQPARPLLRPAAGSDPRRRARRPRRRLRSLREPDRARAPGAAALLRHDRARTSATGGSTRPTERDRRGGAGGQRPRLHHARSRRATTPSSASAARSSRAASASASRVARAFLKDAPILILDEPTSSIDSKTEAVILDALDALMEGRTTFMIAHRLSTVRDADLILVIDDGGSSSTARTTSCVERPASTANCTRRRSGGGESGTRCRRPSRACRGSRTTSSRRGSGECSNVTAVTRRTADERPPARSSCSG